MLKENKQFQVSVKHNNICFYFHIILYYIYIVTANNKQYIYF